MHFELFLYFCVVFLGLQGLYEFQKQTSLTLVFVGNALILFHTIDHAMWDLLLLTVMMTIAQISRIYRGALND